MRKKILFVINTLGHAGAEVAMLELFSHLDPKKYELSLYVLMGQGELVHKLPEHVRLLNIDYSDASVLSKEGRRNMRKNVIQAFFRHGRLLQKIRYFCSNLLDMVKHHRVQVDKLLWKILSDGAVYQKEHYDLAVAYLEGGSTYYVADHVQAAKKAAFIHIDYGNAGYNRKLDGDCYLAFDQIFPISDEVKKHFLEAYPECDSKTKVFHNIINQKKIRERAKEDGGFSDDFAGKRLLTVGRLTYQKAYDIAIPAMKRLKEQGYALRWYVLGEGDERIALEKQIAEAGLEQDFLLVGAVENPYPYYKQCDIYVHATRFEGKSIAIQEAQTLGCAIIASDCNGNREQITQDVDGILCDLTSEGISKSVAELLENEEKRKRLAKAASEKKMEFGEDMKLFFSLLDEKMCE